MQREAMGYWSRRRIGISTTREAMMGRHGTQSQSEMVDAAAQRHGRRHEAPIDIATLIAEEIGPRPPMSLGEAKTAALLDARLRRVGMRLSAESYRAPRLPGYDSIIVGILALIGVASFYWMPLPAIALFAACLGTALLMLAHGDGPLLARRAPSQNVVATRAVGELPRWRLVLLAPLCSPPATGRLIVALGRGLPGRITRVAAAAILLALGIAAALLPGLEVRAWLWYLQALPAATLLLLGIAALAVQFAPATPGAISYAGALATLIGSAAVLPDLANTELWVVGVGAADSRAGINDLLRRYPFDSEQTLFVGLDGIGAGTLCYLAAEGTWRPRLADALLLRLAARVVDGGQAAATPCAYRGAPTLAGELRRRGLRAMTIASLDTGRRVPRQYERDDTIAAVDPAHLDAAVRLVVALARALDAEPDARPGA